MPRLVKKYKSLESQHVELRQQSERTAAALDSSRRTLSQAQSNNEALEESLSKVRTEKSVLAAALEESKRESAILQNRIAGRVQAQPRGEQPAAHPDFELLSEAVREVTALRSEVCSLRSVLAQTTHEAVFSELTTIKGQMAQLLQRCPKEDGFRATTTSRACTPVHESLASPPLQSMASLYTQPGTVDAHRAGATVATCGPQDADKQANAQPTSEASALSTQGTLLCAVSGSAARVPHSLPSPSSNPVQSCALNSSTGPPSPLVRAGQAPTATQPAPPSSTASHHEAGPTLPMSSTAQGQPGPRIHPIPHLPSVHLSSVQGSTPVGLAAKRSTQNGGCSPRKRHLDSVAPTPPPRTFKSSQKKKHKSSADIFTKVCFLSRRTCPVVDMLVQPALFCSCPSNHRLPALSCD